MSEKLKPVRCGCGGEPVVGHIKKTSYLPKDRWYIGCPKCDICTGLYDTEAEVITAWNTAMGERTAKVVDKSVGRHSISDFDWIGKCEKCGNEIQYSFDFCPYCGVKLEWSE